jgi:hypothetical protein
MDRARMEAAREGKTHYDGAECRHGHGTVRYTTSGACMVCSKKRSQQNWKKIHETLKSLREEG